MEYQITAAQKPDLPEIVNIYNWAIENTAATFDTQTKTVQDQAGWFASHTGDFSIFVAKSEGKVIGWASISPWSDRCAYSGTGEVAVYVDSSVHGKGLGTVLLQKVIDEAKTRGFRTLVSKITVSSESSLHLHKKLGFEMIGTMKRVGKKFDQVLDVHMLQILF